MNLYRRLWQVVVCLLVVSGIGLAVFLPWGTLLGLGLVGAVLGALCGVGLHVHLYSLPAPVRYVLVACAGTTVGIVAFAGFVAMIGAVTLLGVVLLAVTCPPAVHVLAARAPHATPSPEDAAPAAATCPSTPLPQPALEPVQKVEELEDSELCWRWRTSFAALQHTPSPAGRLRLIQTRAALLNEMARRNPQGFRRWLNEGARAASDPTRYFPDPGQEPRPRHHQAPKADH